VKVTYDSALHFPAIVAVVPSKHLIDSEYGLAIRKFRRA
jgi:hypothetical protein